MTGIKDISQPGKFRLPRKWFLNNPSRIKHIMRNMIVVRAESHYVDDTMRYIAYSPLFFPVTEGSMTPEYSLNFDENNNFYFQRIS